MPRSSTYTLVHWSNLPFKKAAVKGQSPSTCACPQCARVPAEHRHCTTQGAVPSRLSAQSAQPPSMPASTSPNMDRCTKRRRSCAEHTASSRHNTCSPSRCSSPLSWPAPAASAPWSATTHTSCACASGRPCVRRLAGSLLQCATKAGHARHASEGLHREDSASALVRGIRRAALSTARSSSSSLVAVSCLRRRSNNSAASAEYARPSCGANATAERKAANASEERWECTRAWPIPK
mmetsp:Transcript_34347/g.86243  ORF Transcript_34347/g.86243 Transcript_34347/m.86243 type:complete len:237 (+) Transcript_34347:1043-1753(+)|eukprot:4000870-Prymnesium_polylepis.2